MNVETKAITSQEAVELDKCIGEIDSALGILARARTRYLTFRSKIKAKYNLPSDDFRILNDMKIELM
jgi:hypothetical protein